MMCSRLLQPDDTTTDEELREALQVQVGVVSGGQDAIRVHC